MADLIVIGYRDEETADKAAAEVERLSQDLVIQPDAVAVIRRDTKGRFHVRTTHHEVAAGTMWGLFWGLLFGVLFFVPLLGVAVGAVAGALGGAVTKLGLSKEFEDQVRDLVQPGTSALFLVVDKITPDKAIEALSKFGGTVLKSSLPRELEQEIQAAMSGEPAGIAS
jgi:uncharacterized membrane protein